MLATRVVDGALIVVLLEHLCAATRFVHAYANTVRRMQCRCRRQHDAVHDHNTTRLFDGSWPLDVTMQPASIEAANVHDGECDVGDEELLYVDCVCQVLCHA